MAHLFEKFRIFLLSGVVPLFPLVVSLDFSLRRSRLIAKLSVALIRGLDLGLNTFGTNLEYVSFALNVQIDSSINF